MLEITKPTIELFEEDAQELWRMAAAEHTTMEEVIERICIDCGYMPRGPKRELQSNCAARQNKIVKFPLQQ
jgi:hypothetical protein